MKKWSILIPELGEWQERGNEKACLVCKHIVTLLLAVTQEGTLPLNMSVNG